MNEKDAEKEEKRLKKETRTKIQTDRIILDYEGISTFTYIRYLRLSNKNIYRIKLL
jgi:mRNA-degrading endonuclease RelE of RelBE toxin-antitoxin system